MDPYVTIIFLHPFVLLVWQNLLSILMLFHLLLLWHDLLQQNLQLVYVIRLQLYNALNMVRKAQEDFNMRTALTIKSTFVCRCCCQRLFHTSLI